MAVTKLRFSLMSMPALILLGLTIVLAALTARAAPAPEEAKEAVRLHKLEIAAAGQLAFSEDGKTLIHAANRGVRTWDVTTGKEQTSWDKKDYWVKALSPDGTSV